MSNQTIETLEYKYSDESHDSKAYLLIHGVRGGIDEAYIQTVLKKLIARKDTVMAFNFPYMTRGETVPSGGAFEEEIDALEAAYTFLKAKDKTPIHIIAKSFGGIAVSHWLTQNPDISDVEVSIMGYIPGEGDEGIMIEALRGKLKAVVQGDNDRYASPDVIRAELLRYDITAEVIEIPNADHSYRDTVSANPPPYAFQEDAIDDLLRRV